MNTRNLRKATKLKTSVTPRSRKAWRAWLEKNHAARAEVWLVFYKRHTAKPTVSYNDAVEEALCFGWIDGEKRSIDDERYMHRCTPRKADSRWSQTNKNRVARLIEAGLMAPPGMTAVQQAKRNGRWSSLPQKQKFSMPVELTDRLNSDKQARRFFDSLAPSYRRQYVAWVDTVKRQDTRDRRADEALVLLKRGQKLGMR